MDYSRFSAGLAADSPPPPPLPPIDALSVVTNGLTVKSLVGQESCGRAPWGIEFPGPPCGFFAIKEGQCVARLRGQGKTVRLSAGDILIVFKAGAVELKDCPESQTVPLGTLLKGQDMRKHPAIDCGGQGAVTKFVTGGFVFEHDNNHCLVEALPAFLHQKNEAEKFPAEQEHVLELICKELRQCSSGRYAIINKLVQVLIIQAIRGVLEQDGSPPGNIVHALNDNEVGHALKLIHQYPQVNWSVQKLADEVGMSRSSFAKRFNIATGTSPIAYLMQHRMKFAAACLENSSDNILSVARRVGFSSDASFSTAFKRCYGDSPGQYRSSRQMSRTGEKQI